MKTKLYIIELDAVAKEPAIYNAIADLMQHKAVALLTKQHSSTIPNNLICAARYVFASSGNECYVSGKLRYKHVLATTRELTAWLQANNIKAPKQAITISFESEQASYICAEFNAIFREFCATHCDNTVYINDCINMLNHIPAIISLNYTTCLVSNKQLAITCDSYIIEPNLKKLVETINNLKNSSC
jgi:hypothetical protein